MHVPTPPGMLSVLDSFSTVGIPFLELLLLGRSMEFILRGVQEAIRQVASNHCVQWQSSVLQQFFAPSDHRLHLTGDVLSGHDQVRFTLRSGLRSAADIGVLPYVFRQLHGHVLEQRVLQVPEHYVELFVVDAGFVPVVHFLKDPFRTGHDAACQGVHGSCAANRRGSCPLLFGILSGPIECKESCLRVSKLVFGHSCFFWVFGQWRSRLNSAAGAALRWWRRRWQRRR